MSDDPIFQIAFEQMQRNNDAIEMAVEMSLQQGTCGVFVERRSGGGVTASVHPAVPYGWVYEARVPAEQVL